MSRNYQVTKLDVPDLESSPSRVSTDISWCNINFQASEKTILSDCYGKVMAGEVCAIMGPSGAGKSSLLNVLAGRSANGGKVSISGTVTVGGMHINPVEFRQRIAYVMQDDALMQTATPREALEFSAQLRLPSTTTHAEIQELVSKTLTDLGLDDCADVMIGGPLIKGISGGQRKRTSIGVEIITKPDLLFLDEPTSGLDSYSAQSCVKLFSAIAKKNAAVLCTIHQPASDVFVLFDKVIFMKAGRILYQGPVSELVPYFSKFGYNIPSNFNPADYVMTLSQTESFENLQQSGLLDANLQTSKALESEISSSASSRVEFPDLIKSSLLKQMTWLCYREFTNIRRDTTALIARFGITIFLSILFGLIFLNAGSQDDSNFDNFSAHFGGITFVMIACMFGSAQPVMLAFPFERPMFLREYSTGTYTGIAYFVSKVLWELPLTFATVIVQFLITYYMINLRGSFILIALAGFGLAAASCSVAVLLGCLVKDVKDVTEFAPLLFVPQLLFAGFFIRTELIPVFLRWAQYLCAIKYGLNLVLITEFDRNLPSCDGGARMNCQSVIDNNNIVPQLWWVYMLCLIALFVGFRTIAAFILVRKAKQFY